MVPQFKDFFAIQLTRPLIFKERITEFCSLKFKKLTKQNILVPIIRVKCPCSNQYNIQHEGNQPKTGEIEHSLVWAVSENIVYSILNTFFILNFI